jgi:hypothetical protein
MDTFSPIELELNHEYNHVCSSNLHVGVLYLMLGYLGTFTECICKYLYNLVSPPNCKILDLPLQLSREEIGKEMTLYSNRRVILHLHVSPF